MNFAKVVKLSLKFLNFPLKKIKVADSTNCSEGFFTSLLGSLKEITRRGYHIEYPVKTLNDIKIIQYILADTEFEFDGEAFKVADREFGERGVIQTFYPRSPL